MFVEERRGNSVELGRGHACAHVPLERVQRETCDVSNAAEGRKVRGSFNRHGSILS